MLRIRPAGAVLGLAMLYLSSPAYAEPVDTWAIQYGYDCVADVYNPIRADGTRDPNGDPAPGTDAWNTRQEEHTACTDQRDHDIRLQPLRNVATAQYGEDPYRQPERWDGIRFHWEEFPLNGIPDVPSAEVYLPCSNAPGDCPDLPAGLKRHDPPYPVVVVFHGIIAQYSHHRFVTQAFAEQGYLAVGVNGTIPAGSGPNSQRTENGNDVLNWLASADSGVYGQKADLSRVGFAGHSQGGIATQSYQGDPRVHAMIVYDAGDEVSEANVAQPTMFQRTDGGFATPEDHPDYPSDRLRARSGYNDLKSRGLDIFNFTARATVHTDWNGYGVGLAGNRLIELVINYYSLAWFDRHLKGRLVFNGTGNVVTAGGRNAAAERAYRQAQADDAYARLIARYFDDSADLHNISMGFWDTDLAIANSDPLYGGNIPYQVAGLEVRDRFSPYHQSMCSLTLPNYLAGGTGQPGDVVAPKRRADSGAEGDMRFIGCPEVTEEDPDADGDGVPDDSDLCPGTPSGAAVDALGCPSAGLPPLTVSLAADPAQGDVTGGPLAVAFSATPSDTEAARGEMQYTFYFGDGNFTKQAGSSISHSYPNAGRYTAYAIVSDALGNSDRSEDVTITTTTTVTVDPDTDTKADLKLSFSPASGVAPVTAIFDGSASTAAGGRTLAGYVLNFGDDSQTSGTGTPGNSIRHAYTTPGTFTAVLTVTDSAGDTSLASATLTVTATQATTAQLSVSPSTVRAGVPVTFDGSASIAAPGTSIASYTFDPDDGSAAVTQTVSAMGAAASRYTHVYATPGSYQPSLTVNDAAGATSKVLTNVAVQPTAAAAGAPVSGNRGGGALNWIALLALLGLAVIRRRCR